MSHLLSGFMKGAKATPRGFFAPAIAVWHLLVDICDTQTTSHNPTTQA